MPIQDGHEGVYMKKSFSFFKENLILIILLGMASFLRLFLLTRYPNGTYTDEAYGAYIAYGLLTEGIDDRGYAFPVYFTAWGSGMNALYPYLGVLFFRLFGVSLLVYRLPQALFGILGIGALYVICKELFDKKAALFFTFVLTVNPWHIMMCRLGLESSLAPNMFLIGLMFLILGLRKKNGYLVPAAIFFGLTLYCYAITWLILPLFFLSAVIFCWKWIPRKKISCLFVTILFVMALPLFLFLLINYDILPEIRTPFFSIPKLTGFRGGEFSLFKLRQSLRDFLQITIFEQRDHQELLSVTSTGAYYFFTTPFMMFGVAAHVCTLIRRYKNGKNDLSILLLIWLCSAGIIGILHESPTMIHINMIHIPIIFYGAYGIYRIAKMLKSRMLFHGCAIFYGISLLFFINTYINTEFNDFFDDRPYEAVQRAREIAGEHTSITFFGYPTYKFPNLLWREKFDIRDYSQSAIYNDDLFFADLCNYKNYYFISHETAPDEISKDSVYIFSADNMWTFHKLGFELEQVNDKYAVAAMQIPTPENASE